MEVEVLITVNFTRYTNILNIKVFHNTNKKTFLSYILCLTGCLFYWDEAADLQMLNTEM